MSITILRGLPGSGKTLRLIETVNAALAQKKPVLTFACSDSPLLRKHGMIGERNLLASRKPGVTFPLSHFVSPEECATILQRTTPGTLVAFEEAQAFGAAIVPHWIEASSRGLDVLIALPSGSDDQIRHLNGHEYTELI